MLFPAKRRITGRKKRLNTAVLTNVWRTFWLLYPPLRRPGPFWHARGKMVNFLCQISRVLADNSRDPPLSLTTRLCWSTVKVNWDWILVIFIHRVSHVEIYRKHRKQICTQEKYMEKHTRATTWEVRTYYIFVTITQNTHNSSEQLPLSYIGKFLYGIIILQQERQRGARCVLLQLFDVTKTLPFSTLFHLLVRLAMNNLVPN